jgi:hypothetical protein
MVTNFIEAKKSKRLKPSSILHLIELWEKGLLDNQLMAGVRITRHAIGALWGVT